MVRCLIRRYKEYEETCTCNYGSRHGQRYGGLKQIDPIDSDGHIIIDFSIYDAVRAGFEKVIFIIKRENEQIFRETIGKRAEGLMEVAYVFQELENIPDGFTVPEGA